MVSRKSDSIPMAAVLDFETAKTRLDEFQVERGNFDQLFARVREDIRLTRQHCRDERLRRVEELRNCAVLASELGAKFSSSEFLERADRCLRLAGEILISLDTNPGA